MESLSIKCLLTETQWQIPTETTPGDLTNGVARSFQGTLGKRPDMGRVGVGSPDGQLPWCVGRGEPRLRKEPEQEG